MPSFTAHRRTPRATTLLAVGALSAALTAAVSLGVVGSASAATAPDAPSVIKAVTRTSAPNARLAGTISSTRDVDVYRFTTRPNQNARITLRNLGANYRLQVLSAKGTLLATSDRPARQAEQIYRYLPAGTYYVRIDAPNRAVSRSAYSLAFTPSTRPPVATAPSSSHIGMHYPAVASTWPRVANGVIGSVRLWDTGTTWPELNPSRGVFRWGTLDAEVANARRHGATVDLVLGLTPQWAAANPASPGVYGAGTTSPVARESDWVAYVTAVATRYKGRINTYEAWNEANLTPFWRGTPAQMARLNTLAYQTIKRIDKAAIVLAPSATQRVGNRWLAAYADAGGYRYSDAINFHLYPLPDLGPEGSIALLRTARQLLADKGIRKPVWNTEINYGHAIGGHGLRYPLSTNQQAAYISRTYLLALSNGIVRTYWYAWSDNTNVSVATANANGSTAAPGRALVTTSQWMRGKMTPCTVDRLGTYSCAFTYARDKGVVKWNPTRTVTVVAPPYTGYRQDMYGSKTSTRAGATVRLGFAPVMFRTSR